MSLAVFSKVILLLSNLRHGEYRKGNNHENYCQRNQATYRRSIVDSVIGRLLGIRQPTPSSWGFEPQRLPDVSLQ